MSSVRIKHSVPWLLAAALIVVWRPLLADSITLAVASNFRQAIVPLVEAFRRETGHDAVPVFGSTGKHYAQIVNGAPFDLFFAADAARPELLEQQGIAVPGSRFTYALGRLVLWSPDPDLVDEQAGVLETGRFTRLAIANPALAPYGQAAREVLQARGLWAGLGSRIVRGENIAQAMQFVQSGNAELGFVAWSQLFRRNEPVPGSFWDIPASLYEPIEQQAVAITDTPAGRDFIALVQSEKGRALIREYGYGLP